MAKMYKAIPDVCKDVEGLEFANTVDGSVHVYNSFGKRLHVLTVKACTSSQPVILLPVVTQEEMCTLCSPEDMCKNVYGNATCNRTKLDITKCPLKAGKQWYIHNL